MTVAAQYSSSTEAGVLVSYHRATARPLPKEVRTITGGGTQSPTITIPTGDANPAYLSGSNSYPCTSGVPMGVLSVKARFLLKKIFIFVRVLSSEVAEEGSVYVELWFFVVVVVVVFFSRIVTSTFM
ncbi:hypothetical protein AVEN_223171-1 [Araneus ventricosus]|uniref:Uncharacterized protein n=1 Tax=Araneus ventricosus TaxID=182803 RepID=A0A4Y2FUI3_ARAVE|nr:hypothetical protein AVEN_223171-1 [Araneus ventricosus]